MAAALIEMVTGYALETRSDDRKHQMRAHLEFAATIRESASALADADAHVSSEFEVAYALPQGSEERESAIESASIKGAESAATLGETAARLVQVLHELVADVDSPLLLADIGVSASTLAASVRAAAINIAVDLHLAGEAAPARHGLFDALENLDAVAHELETITNEVRASLDPRAL